MMDKLASTQPPHLAEELADSGFACRNGRSAKPVWKTERYIAFGNGFRPAQSTPAGIIALPALSETSP